jgi:F420-0:gamma-glutamyl ligase-like protein
MEALIPNKGKQLVIDTGHGAAYARYPVKTPVVAAGDDLSQLVSQYVAPHLQPEDMVFISEKIVAISQGRAFPVKDIHPSLLARFLVKFVHKSPHGIGLGSPWTMELAIREVGKIKIIFTALIAGIAKLFGKKGVFYAILGPQVAAIDGPCDYTIPPYNEYAKMAPKNPRQAAAALQERFGHPFVIVDANDLGVNILGKSDPDMDDALLKAIFKDNPLGQSAQQTPIAIVRQAAFDMREAVL